MAAQAQQVILVDRADKAETLEELF